MRRWIIHRRFLLLHRERQRNRSSQVGTWTNVLCSSRLRRVNRAKRETVDFIESARTLSGAPPAQRHNDVSLADG